MRTLLIIFGSVFFAELGDKTQLATMLYATDKSIRPFKVFIAAASALVLSTLLAVFFGETIMRFIPAGTLKLLAGITFIAVGIWTLAAK